MPIFHNALGATLAAVFFVIFVWGTVAWIRNRDPGRWFWGLLGVGQAMIGLQVLAGGILLLMGHRRPWLHYSYGLFAVLVLIVAHRLSRKYTGVAWAVFAVAGLVVTGLLGRAYMTGVGM
jgi:hypothetical protein